MTKNFDIVIQPGWQDSGSRHWQSLWQAILPQARRVAHGNWNEPQLDVWLSGLDATLDAARRPALVVAHSLGCIAVAQHVAHGGRPIAGALLVAPADVERADVSPLLRGFAPVPRAPLPFPVIVVASTDDPYCRPEQAQAFADAWGAQLVWIDRAGHINADSGFGDWPQGLALLEQLAHAVEAKAVTAHG